MTKWESRTEDLGFFPKNEVAFLAFLAFSLLKPMQNGYFLLVYLGFLPKKPCSPYIKYSMAFLAFTWLFPRGKSQGKSRSYPYLRTVCHVLLCTSITTPRVYACTHSTQKYSTQTQNVARDAVAYGGTADTKK